MLEWIRELLLQFSCRCRGCPDPYRSSAVPCAAQARSFRRLRLIPIDFLVIAFMLIPCVLNFGTFAVQQHVALRGRKEGASAERQTLRRSRVSCALRTCRC